ncbi:MAG: MBL fold metallo-hydrolase [Bdellovibrionaceae bacterium]|nr:MBL fold metallo-hydrolase [Pseudobdellovibrionaceae bacterium]MDW8190504.1 MBL fold metallo-hydrolase [Pseudobdellovibrionaceae bacterium]
MKVTFLGACGTVTGSRILLEYHHHRFLLDCGLFQGPRELRNWNWHISDELRGLAGIVVSHAHIDHSGFLPKLVRDGYRGPIYASPPTCDLLKIMLLDAAHLQEEDAAFANRTGYSSHKPALPLYTVDDAQKAISLLYPVPFYQVQEIMRGCGFRFLRAGHILGASLIEVIYQDQADQDRHILFTGDLGHNRSPLVCDPDYVRTSDVLICESTYGDRVVPPFDENFLAAVINKVLSRGGTLVIPAFALGRSQELLWHIRALEDQKKIPHYPVYLDSPMALDVTDIYLKYQDFLKIRGKDVTKLWPNRMEFVRKSDDSMLLAMSTEPKIVVSASGMLQGGRVLHHLKHKLQSEKNGVLFVGYQAPGTKGRLLKNGIPRIRLHHQEVDVVAEIFSIESLSSHADSNELMSWLRQISPAPRYVFLVHGEDEARWALSYRLKYELNWEVTLPALGSSFNLQFT